MKVIRIKNWYKEIDIIYMDSFFQCTKKGFFCLLILNWLCVLVDKSSSRKKSWLKSSFVFFRGIYCYRYFKSSLCYWNNSKKLFCLPELQSNELKTFVATELKQCLCVLVGTAQFRNIANSEPSMQKKKLMHSN